MNAPPLPREPAMKRDKARALTQERVQYAIAVRLDGAQWWAGFIQIHPPVSHPRDRYAARKLHHYDPAPVQRATAPKRRRWRI